MVVRVGHIDISGIVNGDAARIIEMVVIRADDARHADRVLVDAVAVENLYSLVALIDHVDVVINRADGYATQTIELVIPCSIGAQGSNQDAA